MKSLSGLDSAFLYLETPATPMHVASCTCLSCRLATAATFRPGSKRALAKRLHLARACAPTARRRSSKRGAGLNITMMSYAGAMDIGFITARAAVPDVRQLSHGSKRPLTN